MAKGDELVKYITVQVVEYFNTTPERKQQKKAAKEPWQTRWFGMLPLAVSVWGRNREERRRSKTNSRAQEGSSSAEKG